MARAVARRAVTSPNGDAAAAAPILQADGYTKDSAASSPRAARSSTVAIKTPGDYSDFANDVKIAVQSLKSAGIKATFNNVTVNAYNADAASGNFQLLLRWGSGGITPYQPVRRLARPGPDRHRQRQLREAERPDGDR